MFTSTLHSNDKEEIWTSGEIADQWNRNQARRDKIYEAATERMLDLAAIRAGHRVLDIAAGTGGQTLAAARRVRPDGYVLATDISERMLSACAETARQAGLSNVETRIMDAENLCLEPDSFDAVICRSALMFFSDPVRALSGICQAMKPEARMAALVFSTAAKNPYQGIPLAIVRRLGSNISSMFALSEAAALEDTFSRGGLPNLTVHTVSIRRHFASVADLIQSLRAVIFLREPMNYLPPDKRKRAWAEIEMEMSRFAEEKGVDLPGEMLLAVGSK